MNPNCPGVLLFALHSHLPWIPKNVDSRARLWLYEAILDAYVPLILSFLRLRKERVPFQIVLTLSSSLLSAIIDPDRNAEFFVYAKKKRADLLKLPKGSMPTAHLRKYLLSSHDEAMTFLGKKGISSLIDAWIDLSSSGHLDLWPVNGAHGYLPLMKLNKSKELQVSSSIKFHKKIFGKTPRGIWLAECGYVPGLDSILAAHGIQNVILEMMTLGRKEHFPKWGPYAPIITPAGVNIYPREYESAREIWSPKEGFPGHPNYLDFHQARFFDSRNFDIPIRTRRVGNQTGHSKIYSPLLGLQRAQADAEIFLDRRVAQLKRWRKTANRPMIITAPFDTELFGHWWHEGPVFLEHLIRKGAQQTEFKFLGPKGIKQILPIRQRWAPGTGSWGEGGDHRVWLNPKNSWIFRHQVEAEELVWSHWKKKSSKNKINWELVFRNLIQLQGSDWGFMASMDKFPELTHQVVNDSFNEIQKLLISGPKATSGGKGVGGLLAGIKLSL